MFLNILQFTVKPHVKIEIFSRNMVGKTGRDCYAHSFRKLNLKYPQIFYKTPRYVPSYYFIVYTYINIILHE